MISLEIKTINTSNEPEETLTNTYAIVDCERGGKMILSGE